jgi:transcriptional regulator with XRE-family HTH domain
MNSRDALGSLLRRVRTDAGLAQQEVARKAGVDQPMVSVYERDRRQPTWSTFGRLLRAAGAIPEVRIDFVSDGDFTLAELADHLRHATRTDRRRRLVLEFVSRFTQTPADRRRGLLVERPDPTGDVRWDALLGALAEHLSFHDAVDAPQWCNDADRFLDQAWYWVDLPSVRRSVVTSAPTAFRRRNVWVDRRDLERV